MRTSVIIVYDGADSHRLLVTQRDWGLLLGPRFDEGLQFIREFRVYANFTVAGGVPAGSRVSRPGGALYAAAQALLSAVERDADLLRYDYSYGFSGDPARHGGKRSIRVDGKSGIISTRPKGYCYVRLHGPVQEGQPRLDEFIDLRRAGTVQTDDGTLVRSYRRKAPMNWLESLPPLLEFLRSRLARELAVEHQERVAD